MSKTLDFLSITILVLGIFFGILHRFDKNCESIRNDLKEIKDIQVESVYYVYDVIKNDTIPVDTLWVD